MDKKKVHLFVGCTGHSSNTFALANLIALSNAGVEYIFVDNNQINNLSPEALLDLAKTKQKAGPPKEEEISKAIQEIAKMEKVSLPKEKNEWWRKGNPRDNRRRR